MNETTNITAQNPIPSDIMELLGPLPLLSTEDPNLYYRMLAHFARSIQPGDLITWMLIKDLADHRVEIFRYRQMKAALVRAAHESKVRNDWEERIDRNISQAEKLAEMKKAHIAKANAGSPEETARRHGEVDDQLIDHLDDCINELRILPNAVRSSTMTEGDVVAVLAAWIDQLKQIDILLQAAEKRFSKTLEEIDRHLRGLGRYCREELDKIIDAEVVEAPAADAAPAAQGGRLKIVSNNAHSEAAGSPRPNVRRSLPRRASNLPRRSARRQSNQPARRRLAS